MLGLLWSLFLLPLPARSEEVCQDYLLQRQKQALPAGNLNQLFEILPWFSESKPRSKCTAHVEYAATATVKTNFQSIEILTQKVLLRKQFSVEDEPATLKVGPSSFTCEQIEDLRFYRSSIAVRLEYIESFLAVFQQLEEFEGEWRLNRDVKTEKLFCLVNCLRSSPPSSDLTEQSSCSKTCDLNKQVLDYIQNGTVTGELLSRPCLLSGNPLPSKEEFLSLLDRFDAEDSGLAEKIRSLRTKNRQNLLSEQQKLKLHEAQLNQIEKAMSGRSCGIDKAIISAEANTEILRLENSAQGSGFRFQTPTGKTFLATAVHVPAAGTVKGSLQLNAVVDSSHDTHQFQVAPGFFDVATDAVFKEVPKKGSGNALSLVSVTTKPGIGQHFVLVGYPSVKEGKFTATRCRFIGYGPNVDRKSMVYYLDCPFGDSLAGNSGGALLDDHGQVWGVVTQQSTMNEIVAVAPLSVNEKGDPRIGFSDAFLSDHCLESLENPWKQRRCQIFSGSLEMPSLPNPSSKDLPNGEDRL